MSLCRMIYKSAFKKKNSYKFSRSATVYYQSKNLIVQVNAFFYSNHVNFNKDEGLSVFRQIEEVHYST